MTRKQIEADQMLKCMEILLVTFVERNGAVTADLKDRILDLISRYEKKTKIRRA